MTSLTTRSVVLFLCCVIVAQCRAEDLPISFADLSGILNGNFDNIEQITDKHHERITVKGKPALIPSLQKEPVIYLEETINGKMYRRSIILWNESSTDRILYTNYYNFTATSQNEPGTFNTDDLANLTPEDFRISDGCEASYILLSPGNILGQSLDCRHIVNGQHPIYTSFLTCNHFRFESPLQADETSSLLAYDLKQKGPRYPLIDPPEGYVNPCKDGL